METSDHNRELVTRIKRLRQEMDKTLKGIGSVQSKMNQNEGTREMALVVTNIQQARMWAGAALEKLGHELPEEFADKYVPGL